MFSEQICVIIDDIFEQCSSILSNWNEIDTSSIDMHYKYHNSKLNEMLSKFQILLNHHFDVMNDRSEKSRQNGNIPTYKADPSRQLLDLIKLLDIIIDAFKDENIEIKIISTYKNHIELCKSYLVRSGGSPIPPEYKKIITSKYKPIFEIKEQSAFENAKYLIFGVKDEKPEIRIQDVLDNNLEILNSDKILIYDTDIKDSLTYSQFNEWWVKNKKKYSWYKVNDHLQPRELIVQEYYKSHYQKENNPVLIPQVYLHYDPKSAKERERYRQNSSLAFQRMDFLILYRGKRIIIELDGMSHLTTNGIIDFNKYTRQLSYDRTMKFLGYDIFRISNKEIDENAEIVLKNFFEDLYRYLGVDN